MLHPEYIYFKNKYGQSGIKLVYNYSIEVLCYNKGSNKCNQWEYPIHSFDLIIHSFNNVGLF